MTPLRQRMLYEFQRRNYTVHHPRLSRCRQPVCRVLPSLAGTTGSRAPATLSAIPAAGEEA